jgi:hypothetical protein
LKNKKDDAKKTVMLFAPFLALHSAAHPVCYASLRSPRGSTTWCATRWPLGPFTYYFAFRFATGNIIAVQRSAGASAAPVFYCCTSLSKSYRHRSRLRRPWWHGAGWRADINSSTGLPPPIDCRIKPGNSNGVGTIKADSR